MSNVKIAEGKKMNINERAAYIKGLFDGMELDMNDKQNKILKSLIDLVSDMAEEVSELGQCYDDVCDQIDTLDENVTDLEEILFEEDNDDDYDEIYGGDNKPCDCKKSSNEEETVYEVTCPTCNETIALTEEAVLQGSMKCPKCDELLEFDYDEEDTEE